MGLVTFQKFYEIAQHDPKPKTFDDFVNSSFYTAFVKFGSFMVNTAPIYPERFIEYVIKSGVKIDKWCRDSLYEKYIYELIKVEPADGAIQRTIKTMMDWGDANDAEWTHYFKYVSSNRATHDIKEGIISPWVIFNCTSGKEMLARFTDEQLEIVGDFIDPQYWIRRFKTLPADTELAKLIAKEAKIP